MSLDLALTSASRGN